MFKIRSFELGVDRLIGEGEVAGAAHSSIGHEAAIVGACMALEGEEAEVRTLIAVIQTSAP